MDILAEDPDKKPTPKHKRKSRKKKKKKQKSTQNQETDENQESRKHEESMERPELDKKQEPSTIPQQTRNVPPSINVENAIERLSSKDFVIRQNRISDRRTRVFNGRQNLQAKRLALRHLRLQATQLESHVLSALDKQSADPSFDYDALLREFFKRLREVRQKISQEEYAYDRDEKAVTIDESALSSEEYQLYRDFSRSLFPNNTGPSEPIPTVVNPPKEPPTVTPVPNVPVPLHEYETKIGEASIVHETLEQLNSERSEYLEMQRQGIALDSDELEFLESYENVYRETLDRLRVLEKEIRELEYAADETGQLSPSERYIPKLTMSAPTSPLTLPGTTLIAETLDMGSLSQMSAGLEGLGHKRQDHDAISEMSINLHDPSIAQVDNASNGPINDAPGFRSNTSMEGWIAQLPGIPPPISKSAGKAVAFTTREGLRRFRQYTNLVFGARQTASLPGCEDWVMVNKPGNPNPNLSLDCNVHTLDNPQEPERRDSEQSQRYRKALKEFPALDLASSVASLSRRQTCTLDNIEHKCRGN
jgi:hypothetical protein